MSYDDYKEQGSDLHYISPKLGIQWALTDSLRLRLAAFRTVKPVLIASQTLQPTEIAGFNQFFDYPNGTRSETYAFGLDARLLDELYLGAEIVKRDVDTANRSDGGGFTIDQDEDLYRAYVYWTLGEVWAASGELRLDEFRSDEGSPPIIPKRLETFSAPLTISYFSPSGFFGGLGATYVNQGITSRASDGRSLPDRDNDFILVDAMVGYRLPRRLGLIRIEARNILNNGFEYQDDTFREIGSQAPQLSPYIPERSVFAQLILNF